MTPKTSQTYVHQYNWTFIVMYHVCDNEKIVTVIFSFSSVLSPVRYKAITRSNADFLPEC